MDATMMSGPSALSEWPKATERCRYVNEHGYHDMSAASDSKFPQCCKSWLKQWGQNYGMYHFRKATANVFTFTTLETRHEAQT